jgi:hypothetical protein
MYFVGAGSLVRSAFGMIGGAVETSTAQIVGYLGVDLAGAVRYVGISKDPAVRYVDHLAAMGTGRELLNYSVVEGAAFATRLEARIWEQIQILQDGLQRFGGEVPNFRNEIAPKYWQQYGIHP